MYLCLLTRIRLLQVIANGEQVFPSVKEKCCSKDWFASEDINGLEEQIGRLRRLKESVGFLANRVTAIQAGLDSWQSEQINRKLYYLSFLSIIFLPLSIITGGKDFLLPRAFFFSIFWSLWIHINMYVCFCTVFGMNVGGVPWSGQDRPELKDGFINVMLICFGTVVFVLLGFFFLSRIMSWRERSSSSSSVTKRRNWKNWITGKYFLKRTLPPVSEPAKQRGDYQRLVWDEKRLQILFLDFLGFACHFASI